MGRGSYERPALGLASDRIAILAARRATCGLDVVGAMSTLGSMTKRAESTQTAAAAVAAHYG